jgi:hypothetical protein
VAKRIALAVVLALGALVVAFGLVFGTLSPCQALRAEYRRAGEREAGVIGGAMMRVAGELNTSDMTPAECARKAVRLRFLGTKALDELVH